MIKVVELNGRNNTSPNYILEDKTSGPKCNMYAMVGCHFKACTNCGHQYIHFINKFLLFLDNFPTIKNSFTQLYPVCNNFILWKVLICEVTASVQWFWSNLLTFSCFYTFQFILNDLSLHWKQSSWEAQSSLWGFGLLRWIILMPGPRQRWRNQWKIFENILIALSPYQTYGLRTMS